MFEIELSVLFEWFEWLFSIQVEDKQLFKLSQLDNPARDSSRENYLKPPKLNIHHSNSTSNYKQKCVLIIMINANTLSDDSDYQILLVFPSVLEQENRHIGPDLYQIQSLGG